MKRKSKRNQQVVDPRLKQRCLFPLEVMEELRRKAEERRKREWEENRKRWESSHA